MTLLSTRPMPPELWWAVLMGVVTMEESRELMRLSAWDDETTAPDHIALAMRRYLHFRDSLDKRQ